MGVLLEKAQEDRNDIRLLNFHVVLVDPISEQLLIFSMPVYIHKNDEKN